METFVVYLTKHLTLFLLMTTIISLDRQSTVALKGLYPKPSFLSNLKPVKASSTCGLQNSLMKYCMSSADNASLTTCTELDCLLDCCPTCGKAPPASTDLLSGSAVSVSQSSDVRPGSPVSAHSKSFNSGSLITFSNLAAANIKELGLSFTAWVKQQAGNTGALISKGSYYTLIIKQFDLEFIYTTKDAPSVIRKAEIRNVNTVQGKWQHVALTIYDRRLSVFTNGQIQRTIVLDGVLNDASLNCGIGQNNTGGNQFRGLIQDAKYFTRALSNREVIEAMNGTLPAVYGYSYCRCPPSHPRLSLKNPFFCIENGVTSVDKNLRRLRSTSHPAEYLVDEAIVNFWVSKIVENATIEVDLVYHNLQIYYVQIMFYGPPAKGIKIERSRDGGRTYTPWQYYAQDCPSMFGLANNGQLTAPDSVNCLQIVGPVKPDFEPFSFQTNEAGPLGTPQRPIGEAGCSDFHCSPKLLEFVKATNVRVSFYQHMLVRNPAHQYSGVRKFLVAGTCDCYGHSDVPCTMYGSNSTHNASYTCTCDARTFTEGPQCERCQPLYRDKPFKRGVINDAYPCKKCNCNNHATSCTYNRLLDSNPNDRASLGGGVCDNCMHNTTGRFCHTCKPMFYRPSGKAPNAIDACSPCDCTGAGVVTQGSDCQRDDSNSSVVAGQCLCKRFAAGRQCLQCKNGYYYLRSSHPDGCIPCECNTLGTQGGSVSCDIVTGQCTCKANVQPGSTKCSTCRTGFYGLSGSNPDGCTACNCDPWGSSDTTTCDAITGQCTCKATTEGRRCHTCRNGYFGMTQSGCQQCRCNVDGTDPAKLTLCDKKSGKCACRQHVEGQYCDRCKVGHYNLSRNHATGCIACNCDSKGTQGNSGLCNQVDGSCVCKTLVTGRQCNVCKTGSFNLSASNPEGCLRCNCYPNGTVGGDTTAPGLLPCFNTGSCRCLTNVNGLRCDSCTSGNYWNPNGVGCISCNCNLQGSASAACNSTGYCSCVANSGVGGRLCDQCLSGYYSFNNGRCTSCGCSTAGSSQPTCDATGRCTSCKANVIGTKCDQCKAGTSNLQASNPYGCSGPPSEQGPPSASNIASRSMTLTWFPPDNPNGLILRYELYRNNSLVYNGSSQAYNDSGLTPYTAYTYHIIVHTAGGSTRSVDSSRIFRTRPDKPEGVRPPQMSNILARSMLATWLPPLHPNDAFVLYRLSSTNSRTLGLTNHYNGNLLSYQVISLSPFTVYNFTITACTSMGCATSPITTRATRSARPDSQPAPYVTAQPDGTSVLVYWDAPAQPNGVILFYDLFMRTSPFSSSGTNQATKLNPEDRNYTVTGLTPYTSYEFRVVSYTSQVSGDTSSTWTRIRTQESVPSGEAYISPRAVAASSSSVNVSWSAPRYPNGIITRYEVYRYEIADLSRPILSGSTSGALTSTVVTGLVPYTRYQLSVKACNSKGCTGYSSRTTADTLASAPSGQGAPNITAINSSSIFLSWFQPSVLNGPLPVGYDVERTFAALHNPPPQVETGVRFSSFGFYKLSSSIIPDSVETRLEFNVRTLYPDGLVFYAASLLQEDMFAVEIRSGKPWFIFDTDTGPTAFTTTSSQRIDDGKWHKVLVSRNSRSGTITVDDTSTGNGNAAGTSNIIGQISSIYVGGIPSSFPNLRTRDTVNVVLKRLHFTGCIRDMKYKSTAVDFNSAVEKMNVDPLYAHCPSLLSSGFHFKGGGYLVLKSGLFTGRSIFFIQFSLRTTYSSGLVLFAHGTGTTSIAITLNSGNFTLLYRSPTQTGSQEIPARGVCDGNWHTIMLTGFGPSIASLSIDGFQRTISGLPADAQVSSNIYIGGVPQGSQAERLWKTLVGDKASSSFGGCMKNIKLSNDSINAQEDVISSRNVALDGCPAGFTSSDQFNACTNPVYTDIQRSLSTTASDDGLNAFTEYLYRVKSFRSGISGFGASPWVAVRTKEGGPGGLLEPVISNVLARSLTATWQKPSISGGLITKYQVKAINRNNASDTPVIAEINNPGVNSTNLQGLSPYTMYNVSVIAFTAGGSTESKAAMITTQEAAPEMLQPITALSFPYYLIISWKPPLRPNGIIILYQIYINGVTKHVNSGNQFTYNVTGLLVYTSYSVKLSACNNIACISVTTSVFTGQLPPSGVHPPQLRVLGSRRIDVTWQSPDVLNGVISKYEVETAVGSSRNFTIAFTARPDLFHTVLANMTPGTQYQVRMVAFTAGGGTTSLPSTATTLESAPEDIPKPVVIPVSYSVLNVTMQVPLKPNGVIIYYVLLEDDSVVMNSTVLRYQGTGFRPYSRHTYRTRACTAKGCGESDLAVAFTLDAQPVGNVVLVANALSSRSFRANWTAVQTPNGIIRYSLMAHGEFYINVDATGMPITYETHRVTKVLYNGSLANSSYTYVGILPYTNYTIHVNASNRAGYLLSNNVTFSTPSAAPDGVKRPSASSINSTALNVSWTSPGRTNGLIISYQLIAEYPDNSGIYRQVVFQRGLHYYQVVSNLQPYTTYRFKLVAASSGGSTESGWTNVTTDEDIPEHIDQPKVLNIESRRVLVEISAPSKPNGVIIHYILYVNGTEKNRTLQTRFHVVELQPFTYYVAQLEACIHVGCKMSAITKSFQTLQDVPQGQPAPLLNANGSRSVVISWSKPTVTNGIILSYQIQRRISGQAVPISVAVINASISGNLYIDTGVRPWTTYEYRIIARTVVGGTPSPYNSVKTPEGDPEGIAAPSVTALSSSSLLVQWTAPAIPNGYVTHYYVKTAGHNQLANRTTSLSLTLTGLASYVEYAVVISACTVGGCGDSPATRMRTLTSLPAGQNAPTAEATSSTSLLVRWNLPSHPNGPIMSFVLWRRTVEDIVSGNASANITYPTAWFRVYSGVNQMFGDTGLGIYSLQSYKVMAITTVGNTTSNSSAAFRTGAAVPLESVSLTASAIGHSRVRLSWTFPSLRTRRGPIVRLDVSYEIVNGPVFVSASLAGNYTHTIIMNLVPNTRYAFKVALFNGAGSKESAKAFALTLAGFPQGFDNPTVYVSSATEIRVTWTAPRVPNGDINNYTIFGNSKQYDTVPRTTFVHTQTGFKPFTDYAIQVRVCTLYACTFSGSVSAKTLSAAPGLINPPKLQPLSSTSIRVQWDIPVEPNGIIIGFKLFRRHVYNCPTRPTPVTKCTYIECSLNQEICAGKCYNPASQKCCNGTLHALDARKTCCGTSYLRKNSNNDVCCGGRFHVNQAGYQCCYGHYTRVSAGQVCCNGQNGVVVGIGNACCGDVPYPTSGNKICICSALYTKRNPEIRKCCGGKVVSIAQRCCGNDTIGVAHDTDSTKSCCGTSYVDTNSTLCCQNSMGQFQVHTHSNAEQKSGMKCCGTNQIMNTMNCCNNQSYDNSTQVCSDRSTFNQFNCGTGITCPTTQASRAYCNRCNFDTSTTICGSVLGYFDPSANQTSDINLCYSDFVEVLRNPSDASLRLFVDTGLQPHNLYDYYVTAINSDGNSSSTTNRTRTLMSSPEGLSAPQATVLSASSIVITWSAPTNPNGVISAYKLYRIKWETKEERLIFSGLSFSHMDTQGLEAHTGYLYKLSVCTVLCSNVSAARYVYTQQAVPEQVNAPLLSATSATSIRVNWSLPAKPNGNIVRYNVSRLINATYVSILPVNDLGLGLTQLVVGLKPYTLYTFRVTACTVIGCASGPSASIHTLQAPPAGVKPPSLTIINQTTVEIEWQSPLVNNGLIQRYVLHRNSSVVTTGLLMIFRDTGLTPNTIYMYQIEAVNGGGGTRSVPAYVKTPESSPEGVAVPILTAISSSELRCSWSAPAQPNGVITQYALIYNEPGKDLFTVQVQLLTSYVIGRLKPYTEYEVRVQACTSKGCGTGNRSLKRTLEAIPAGQMPPTATAKSDSIIELKWASPSLPNGVIIRYEATRRENNAAISFVIYAGLAFEYIDTSLKPYTLYQYKIKSRNSVGTTESTWTSVRTMSGVPQGLAAPSIVVLSGVSVQASWPQPTNPNGLITQYEVRARRFQQANNESVVLCCIQPNVLNVTVTGLKPATTYEFRVAARSDGGIGYSTWTSAKTKDSPPRGISMLRSNKNPDGLGDGTSLQVLWSSPSIPNGVITNYILYLDTYVMYQGLLLQTIIRRLQPYTNYSFQLEVCNSAGCTKGSRQNLITAEVTPIGQIPPTFGNITSTSVTLNWKPPISPNGRIMRYDIIRRITTGTRRRRRTTTESTIYSTNDTSSASFSYTDSSLLPFSTYQYKIRAVNSKGQVDSDWAVVKTSATAPTGFSPPTATALGGFSIRVQWSVPRSPNGDIRYYELYRNNTKVLTLSALGYTDTGLNPVTLYVYSVRVCTTGGCTMSTVTSMTTLQATPGEMRPPALLSLDASRIQATWTAPSVSNGVIQRYQLRLSNNAMPVFEGLAFQYTISGLKSYTSYSVTISACTSRGCGVQSSAATTRTHESMPQDLSPPSLYILGPTIIDATWTAPRTPNGLIRYYTLRRGNVVVYNGTALRFIDTNVSPGTRYTYTISCTNGAGTLTSLPQQSSTTHHAAPQNVSTPALRALSRSSIQVTWDPPKIPNGIITGYYVLYDKKEMNAGTNRHFTVTNLNYYTMYEFRISACTSAGCASGLPASIRTLESAPTNQSAPTFSSADIGARYVVVQWIGPQKPNGVITHYELRRRQSNSITKLVYTGPKLVFNDSSSDILPNMRYEYQVMSFNGAGSAQSAWVPVTTNIAKPEQVKPIVVLQQDIKATSFLFSVEEPLQPNGRITRYIVELIGVKNITLVSIVRGMADGLMPYTSYSVKVHACNTAGCSSSIIKVIRTSVAAPTGFSISPVVVSKTSRSIQLRWHAPTTPNAPVVWYAVNQRYTCPQPSIPSPLCVAKQATFNASQSQEYTVTGLLPYLTYMYKITVHNTAGFAVSSEIHATTIAENPVVIKAPIVTVKNNDVTIDWTNSFELRSALVEYSLEENNLPAYSGNKLSVTRANREVGVYAYIIRLNTSVNGRPVQVAAPIVKVNVGDVPVVVLRRRSAGNNVYIREKDPLPLRPKVKMGSRTGSRSTLATPSPSLKRQYPLTPNLYSSRKELLGSSQGLNLNQTPLNDVASVDGPFDPTWDTFLKSYNGNGRDHDSGLFEENNMSPILNDDDETPSLQSFQKGRIVFPDTHL
eukprot:gene20024-21985_t